MGNKLTPHTNTLTKIYTHLINHSSDPFPATENRGQKKNVNLNPGLRRYLLDRSSEVSRRTS
jgi:hypothetical protein